MSRQDGVTSRPVRALAWRDRKNKALVPEILDPKTRPSPPAVAPKVDCSSLFRPILALYHYSSPIGYSHAEIKGLFLNFEYTSAVLLFQVIEK